MLQKIRLCKKCYNRTGIKCLIADPYDCFICSGILWKIDEIADDIIKSLDEYEFETFLVGSRIHGSLKAIEDYLKLEEEKSLKYQFNKELGREIEIRTGKKLSFKNPDVTIVYDLENLNYSIYIKPLYIYGRYKKRVRGLSQTRWLCSKCNGKGCLLCNWTGKKYVSVEELISEPVREFVMGTDAVLHGAGREDVDARMLGNGRPFIVEVKNPKRRYIDLRELERLINENCRGKVEVLDLKLAEAKDIEFLKSARFKKIYRVKVLFGRDLSEDEIRRAIEELKNRDIHQRTPLRVLHRRSDLLRVRKVYDIELLFLRRNIAVLRIEADSGLYIKEFISGDQGRTRPSLSEVLNVEARVEKLDVIRVGGGL